MLACSVEKYNVLCRKIRPGEECDGAPSMTTGEIISSAVAFLSLVVSGITAYLTLFTRFKVLVLPKRRVFLTQVAGVPYLVLECQFINEGVKYGSVEDILVEVVHNDTGSKFKFAPKLIRPQFNIYDRYQLSDFNTFSTVSLGSKDRKEAFIAFIPLLAEFSPPKNGTFTIYTSIKVEDSDEFVFQPRIFSLKLNEEIVANWTSSTGEAQSIEAVEIGKNRQQHLSPNGTKRA
jgi:hypothetical protein